MKPIVVYNFRFLLPGIGAMVIYPFILFRLPKEKVHDSTRVHEGVHFRQVQKYGWFRFYFTYVWDYLMGLLDHGSHWTAYRFIPYEVEAYKIEWEYMNGLDDGYRFLKLYDQT